MSSLNIVRNLVIAHEGRYEALLKVVKAACLRAMNDFGSSVVLRVYSRSDKQGGSELKETTKILESVGGTPTLQSLQDLSDIIGVTIVVQYPDQIGKVLDRVAELLAPEKIVEATKRKDHRGTYFATHAIFISHKHPHLGLKCEVQCKTLLHDAWSAKMHDLTYKPQGSMDLRLRGLVEAISATLEGLEQQSQIVRDIITARQTIERRPFQASLEALHAGLVEALMEEWREKSALDGLEELCRDIEAAGVQLGTDQEEPDLASLAMRIRDAAAERKSLRVCWILGVRLVGFRIEPDRLTFLSDLAERIIEGLPSLLSEQMLTERELRSVPLGFYVVQNFDLAIDIVDRLLEGADHFGLTDECRMLLTFNKATWLLERESMRRAKPAVAAGTQREATRLLAEFRAGYDTSKFYELVDTEGLMKIVFGTTKEEVREGLDLCNRAATLPTEAEECPVAAAYAEWRTHLGWRRYFELAESAP